MIKITHLSSKKEEKIKNGPHQSQKNDNNKKIRKKFKKEFV